MTSLNRKNLKTHHTLTATYNIVTPLFIGDAEQKATDISPASIKGALRFWWRALNWGRIRETVSCNELALMLLHTQEGELFGSSADNGKAAKFTLRSECLIKESTFQPLSSQTGIQYLLGQGLYHFNNGCLRTALEGKKQDNHVTVGLTFSHKVTKAEQAQLQEALLALGLLGGLGSRNRKGFGSLTISSLKYSDELLEIPENKKGLKDWIVSRNNLGSLPPLSAFSGQTRIDLSAEGQEALKLLDEIGKEQQIYRSWGKQDHTGVHKVNYQDAEQNFRFDHDLLERVIEENQQPHDIPKRSVFGLPHNYFFSSIGNKADFSPSEKDRSRRASPLFIHIHQFPDNTIVAIQTLFKSKFLPDGEQLTFDVTKKYPRKKYKKSLKFNETRMLDWQVIEKYMDRFNQFTGWERIV
jgi:CRISPR-associated protein Cmr1